jgi:hypothetical protein
MSCNGGQKFRNVLTIVLGMEENSPLIGVIIGPFNNGNTTSSKLEMAANQRILK